jgi:hypothetical protein
MLPPGSPSSPSSPVEHSSPQHPPAQGGPPTGAPADTANQAVEKPQPPSKPTQTNVEELLPPGAGTTSTTALVSEPEEDDEDEPVPSYQKKGSGDKKSGPVIIPTEDGAYVALREPVKTVGSGADERELRTLTPEEKKVRRIIRNIVVWTICTGILAGTMFWLVYRGS